VLFKSIFFLCLLVHFSSSAQQDSVGKSGKWIYLGKDKPISDFDGNFSTSNEPLTGYHINYRNDSTKSSDGNYEQNIKVGIWNFYFEDGITISEKIEFTNRQDAHIWQNNGDYMRDGVYEYYYRNGQLKKSWTYYKGRPRGLLTTHYESGCIEYVGFYGRNYEQGPIKFYYDCDSTGIDKRGQLEFEYTSQSGIAIGPATRYSKNGDVIELIEYGNDGRIISSLKLPVNPSATPEKSQ
jgi:antitoxin component YwqK of YwqJK toxin-antitoxin module